MTGDIFEKKMKNTKLKIIEKKFKLFWKQMPKLEKTGWNAKKLEIYQKMTKV